MRRTFSIGFLSSFVAISAALLSGAYYLIKLRQECDTAPLLRCATRALTPKRSDDADQAERALEKYKRERQEAEYRAKAAEERRRVAEKERRAAEEARQVAEKKEQAAEDARKAYEQSKREREEAERRRRVAEEERRAAEQARQVAEEKERAAEEARKRKREEEDRRRVETERKLAEAQKTVPEALKPNHRYWASPSGAVYEYTQAGAEIALVLSRQSVSSASAGWSVGTRFFAGTHSGSSNRISGIVTGYSPLRPGCVIQSRGTLTVEPNKLIIQTHGGLGACGYMFVNAETHVLMPAR